MTVKELFDKGLEALECGGVKDSKFDCECLFERFTGYNKTSRLLYPDREVTDGEREGFISSVERRLLGEPLQYILGSWDFMGFEFSVGQGVLIPRPETELLAEIAVEFLKDRKDAVVYDLCAGSGAIGLSVAKLCPDCRVYLFEKYDEAFEYLKTNTDRLKAGNVQLIKRDIFDGMPDGIDTPDLILSNPPYVKKEEISSLQSEVGYEPVSALDGGEDGLDFYRCIHDKWFTGLKKGSQLILECGDSQSADILSMFDTASESQAVFDFNNIDRIVRITV